MATLREYFVKDFPQLKISKEGKAKHADTGEECPFTLRLHYDYQCCAKFISIYVPSGIDPTTPAFGVIQNITQMLEIEEGIEVRMGFEGTHEHVSSRDLKFTGIVYIYGEEDTEQSKVEALVQQAETREIKIILRGETYVTAKNRWDKPVAFISHDSRDKETVEKIVLNLQKRMCSVWYDEYSLCVGDSLRESIEEGLKECKRCVLILSPHFISNDGWTKAEFDTIYTREIVEKRNRILPVWLGVTRDQVYEYSPRLADRIAVNLEDVTEASIEKAAEQLHRAIVREKQD